MRRASTRLSKTILSMLIFGYAFLFIPIFFLIVTSFNESDIPSVWTGFSLKWFLAVFEDDELLRAALTSLEVACISATGAVVLGVLAAAATTSGYFRDKNFLNTAIIVPIVMPEVIIGFSLLMLFMSMENILGFPKERGIMTVATGHIVATMAYVHMTVRARLLSFDNSLEEAALDLGARPLTVFLQIKIPVIAKSILSGWLLAFTLSLDDLVIASFLSGPGSTTLPIMIFSSVRISISPCINALATMFIALVSTCLTIAFLIARKNKVEE